MDAPDLSVVLPTIDEAPNLRLLFPRLRRTLSKLGVSSEILVIDEGSTDGTPEIAREEGAVVVAQSEPGFGRAIRLGIEKARGRHIMTMDADGSHPPEALEDLWKAREGFDLVIGSRYIHGGSVETSPLRHLLSRVLHLFDAAALGLPVADGSSGLRLYRAAAVKALVLRCRNAAIQEEIIVKLLKNGGRLREVPFHYAPRAAGKSKVRILDSLASYLRMLARRG
jgi:glycosyltransferase involved in cell wall biosynthesis